MLFKNETHWKSRCPGNRYCNTLLCDDDGELLHAPTLLKNTSEATTNHAYCSSILISFKDSNDGTSMGVFSSPHDAIADRDGSVAIVAFFVKNNESCTRCERAFFPCAEIRAKTRPSIWRERDLVSESVISYPTIKKYLSWMCLSILQDSFSCQHPQIVCTKAKLVPFLVRWKKVPYVQHVSNSLGY